VLHQEGNVCAMNSCVQFYCMYATLGTWIPQATIVHENMGGSFESFMKKLLASQLTITQALCFTQELLECDSTFSVSWLSSESSFVKWLSSMYFLICKRHSTVNRCGTVFTFVLFAARNRTISKGQ
jgi:hypothetical protein